MKHLLVPNKGEVDADLRLNDIIVNKSQIKMITDVNELLNDFNNLCNASPKQMCARMEWEAEEELLEASSENVRINIEFNFRYDQCTL